MESLENPPVLHLPEKTLEFNGHVIGMAFSPDNRFVYVNVRSWPENAKPNPEEPPPISEQIEIHVIDLRTLQNVGQVH